MKLLKTITIFITLVLATNLLNAGEAEQQQIEQTQKKLGALFYSNSVQFLPKLGLYQIEMEDGTVLFSNADGDRFVIGSLYAIEGKHPVNLTERSKNEERFKAVSALNKKDLIIFPANRKTTSSLYVFTDVDCVYCRQFHSEMDIYNSNGVEVRYIAWPRCGTNCPSYDKMVAVWCAEDPRAAMTTAKKGIAIEPKVCDNPVKDQYELGVRLGLQGTPFIMLDNGTSIPGYKPASAILDILKRS